MENPFCLSFLNFWSVNDQNIRTKFLNPIISLWNETSYKINNKDYQYLRCIFGRSAHAWATGIIRREKTLAQKKASRGFPGCENLHELHLHWHVDGEEHFDGVGVSQDQGILQRETWAGVSG